MDGRELELQARETARHLLASLANRWRHTEAVARRARIVAELTGIADPHLITAGAWLHDVGYSPSLWDTGFHPVDGARYLCERQWPPAVVGLVAHHSGARFVAMARGSLPDLADWAFEDTPSMDILTYADQTTGPTGRAVGLEERMMDMLRRRGPDSPSASAHPVRSLHLRAVRCRIESRLLLASPKGWSEPWSPVLDLRSRRARDGRTLRPAADDPNDRRHRTVTQFR